MNPNKLGFIFLVKEIIHTKHSGKDAFPYLPLSPDFGIDHLIGLHRVVGEMTGCNVVHIIALVRKTHGDATIDDLWMAIDESDAPKIVRGIREFDASCFARLGDFRMVEGETGKGGKGLE